MSLRQRIVRWALSPLALVSASFGVQFALDEWRATQASAEFERREAERSKQNAGAEDAIPPLFKAIRDRDAQGVRSAVGQGADPNAGHKGTGPLNFAFLKNGGWPGNRDVIEALLAGGADVNAPMNGGHSALHLAADRSGRDVIELLLDRGANINALNKRGETPLMRAERLEIAEVLIARGAKWSTGETELDPDGARIRGAARKGDVKLIELLLSKGADPNRTSKGGGTPLLSAVAGRHTEAVRTLLAAGARVDVRIDEGTGLLHIAAELNQLEIASLLIAAGADVNATRDSGWTPLHIASSRCHEDVAALLIANGAKPDARDKHGKAPLPCYAFAKRPPRGTANLVVSCRV